MSVSFPKYRKKLIEVDLPLNVINKESSHEKTIQHGHPSTIHIYWARRPLATCRAIIFASMVDDPSSCPERFPTEQSQRIERDRLHNLIGKLIKWENSNDDSILAQARYEIANSIARSRNETLQNDHDTVLQYLANHAPIAYDPFCGSGSIPLEAQRLGMKAIGSDLNPIAVLITKALIELPHKFNNKTPINPGSDPLFGTTHKKNISWRGVTGLANDIRYYGNWIGDEAYKRIGHFYPQVQDENGNHRTVIAWLWTRTIPCPNPLCGVNMPTIKNFQLSKRRGNQHWIRPIIDHQNRSISFIVQNHNTGVPKEATVNRNGVTCIACQNTVDLEYVREQARMGNMVEQMIAIVADGDRKRIFLSPKEEHIQTVLDAKPKWYPNDKCPKQALGGGMQKYGIIYQYQLFTERQLLALTTFSDLIQEVRYLIIQHGGDNKYADVILTYLVLAIGKMVDSHCKHAIWKAGRDSITGMFPRPAIAMVWDFAEANPFSTQTKSWTSQIKWIARSVENLPTHTNYGKSFQSDAATATDFNNDSIIITDPPYYDNIAYADLSDFFYTWIRPLLKNVYSDLFATISTPKMDEIISNRYRFNNTRQRFENLLGQSLKLMRKHSTYEYPLLIFYAYKQHENKHEGRISTGWETMLNALITSGFQIIRTWSMHTELASRPISLGTNALGSSIVLVCRPRPYNAHSCIHSEFLNEISTKLPIALDYLTRENHIAPTDLAQAMIGPGMEIYSQYSKVETISGESISVRQALIEINNVIAKYFEHQEGKLDSETRFCIDWLKEHSYDEGTFGEANVLSQAQNIDITNLSQNHQILNAQYGKVQLLPIEYFSPSREIPNVPMTTWEGCMRIAYHMDSNREDAGGIDGAARDITRMDNTNYVEQLAYILYNYYDNLGKSQDAHLFNNIVTNWQVLMTKANNIRHEKQLI